jgi:hypothetical protein
MLKPQQGWAVEYLSILGGRGDVSTNRLRAISESTSFLAMSSASTLSRWTTRRSPCSGLTYVRELLRGEVLDAVAEFVERINKAVKILEMEKDMYEGQKIGMHVDAALIYTEAVETAWSCLRGLPIEPGGLASFTRYLGESPRAR